MRKCCGRVRNVGVSYKESKIKKGGFVDENFVYSLSYRTSSDIV